MTLRPAACSTFRTFLRPEQGLAQPVPRVGVEGGHGSVSGDLQQLERETGDADGGRP